MTPLSEALTAAQKRALQSLEKGYVAGKIDGEAMQAALHACGISDDIEIEYLTCSLDVLREWGAAVPAENGTKSDPTAERMSAKQRGFIEQLCREKTLSLPDDLELLTKAQDEALRVRADRYEEES